MNHGIDIRDLKQHVVNPTASLIEEIFVATMAFERLNQLNFDVAQLDEGLLDSNIFFDPMIVVLGVGSIGPFYEAKRANTEQGCQ
ncbi:MAG: hypothetical protein WBW53_03810 [Terriglobales bacterium]